MMVWPEFFSPNEFLCPCCGSVDMQENFIRALNEARRFSGVPFSVASGFRCARYNAGLKDASPASSHMSGFAADIRCVSSVRRSAIIQACHRAGITRIGVAKSFLHLDTDPAKIQNLIWVY